MSLIVALALGFLAAAIIALAGYRARALTPDGALAAIVVGTLVFGCGGLRWAGVMVGFFVLSSALSRVGRRRKRTSDQLVEKGSRRDATQVLANGGVAALLALAYKMSGSDLFFPAFLGTMAAATADTWSTEIGGLSRRAPRSILNGKIVEPGVSGGVTPLGLLAAAAGGLVIGVVGGAWNASALRLIMLGLIAGVAGSVFDSVLGASIQQTYRCPTCGTFTERTTHDCGTATLPVRGLALVNNDTVNGLTTIFGAIAGAILFALK
ncbi:MAG TPA: DUF92 domain-containing protein [Nitrolancea sp.]